MSRRADRAAGWMAAAVAGALLATACSGDTPAKTADPGANAASGLPTTGEAGAPTTGEAPSVADPVAGSGQAVTIAFAGDMNFVGANATRLANDPAGAVGPFTPMLSGADLAVGNLETAITTGGTPESKQFTFRTGPEAIDALRAGGFDTVSMANNHGRDFGAAGLADSLAARDAQPDPFIIGIGHDEEDAFKPFQATVKGQRISVIAATQILDSNLTTAWTATGSQPGLASAKHVDKLVAAVKAARADSDTVIVFLHWGTETQTCPNDAQPELAEQLAAAGADIVVGGHAHRVLSGGFLPGTQTFVDYGLGNFLFKAQGADSAKTGVLLLTVTGRTVDNYEWKPGTIVDSQPKPLDGGAATAALAEWNGLRGCAGLSATAG